MSLETFKKDLASSIPLRNVFRLSGITDEKISARIDLIKESDEKRYELQEVLSEKTTKYINGVWKEHKINIHVNIEKDLSCKVSIEDKDNRQPKFKMDQRSDGFKQFVSILLNLSAENEVNVLKNKIILLDEPEVHLHPSGIKYLRDELLRISENNYVVIASHSIFMVDKKVLDRHYSVTKDSAITQIVRIDDANPLQEEVIYEAFGTSLLEVIGENILVFEGRSDKDYYDFFSSKFGREIHAVKFHTIAANGVEKVPNYTRFLKESLIKGYAIVDSDKDGMTVKKQVVESDEGFRGRFFEINDFLDTGKKSTLEDLFPIEEAISYFKKEYEVELSIDPAKPLIEQLKEVLKAENKYVNDDKFKHVKIEFHRSMLLKLSKMKKEDIQKRYKTYYDFFVSIQRKLK